MLHLKITSILRFSILRDEKNRINSCDVTYLFDSNVMTDKKWLLSLEGCVKFNVCVMLATMLQNENI